MKRQSNWIMVNIRKTCWPYLIVIFLALCNSSLAGPGTNQSPPNATAKTTKAKAARKVDVNEFEKLWRDTNNIVLDVRTRREFEAGHIPGAKNLDVTAPDFDQKISGLKKETVYLVHCGAGVRSARACERMSALGFTNLIDLPAGFKGWESAGKKIEK